MNRQLTGHWFISSARIKIHRYCAFSDRPIFPQKHCDLKPTTLSSPDHTDQIYQDESSSCACSGSFNAISATFLSGLSNRNSPPSAPNNPSPPPSILSGTSKSSNESNASFPFSNHASRKICLKAALNIVHAFETLPYPFLASNKQIPRTMPSMSCCAMQSSYALLMIRQKTQMANSERSSNDVFVQTMLVKIHRALQSIATTLANYSLAAEAIAGMRGTWNMIFLIRQLENLQC